MVLLLAGIGLGVITAAHLVLHFYVLLLFEKALQFILLVFHILVLVKVLADLERYLWIFNWVKDIEMQVSAHDDLHPVYHFQFNSSLQNVSWFLEPWQDLTDVSFRNLSGSSCSSRFNRSFNIC